MTILKRFVTIGSLSILGLFGIFVVSTPFLREPPTPVVNVTIEPQPLSEDQQSSRDHEEPTGETTEDGGVTTSPAYQTGERTGEQLNHLWTETKDFTRGLWFTLTEKE
ncbi:hypothetical protein DBR36_03525 [Microbacterium sp. HMWF026]|uniref:hypothetical protein n=1 Tax=Microbacterium sp. HMWF026 TaxID=2056861 RepID=UPI000D3525C0|nr:hypothetical protein [Microbacterium sp. HMWF026]PTT21729.1 hypothetical protein DBR36_03525 [Microbacterium sp. HMWF026]